MKDFNYKEYIKEYIKKHNNVSNLLIRDQELFLDVSLKILDVLTSIKPPKLTYWEISTNINNPKNNNKELINPLSN